MVSPLSADLESFSEKTELSSSNVTELRTEGHNNNDNDLDEHWEDEPMDREEEQFTEEVGARDFSQNQVFLTFSWSLMNQIRYLARTEGIEVEDLLIELVAEGVTKRAFEDQNKPPPSHLMTRNGYVNNIDGNSGHSQPQMSHHALNNNRMQNGHANRNKPGMQSRNNQYNNPRYQNQQNRNYQGNNNRNNQQGNTVSFRQNGNSYNTQQRYNSRNENGENSSQPPKNKKY